MLGFDAGVDGDAPEQLIEPDAPIALFSWCFLRRRLDAIRGAPVNSGVMLLLLS